MDITAGQKARREMTVTEEMVRAYAEITGDYNPLHFDSDFANRTRFGRLITQGGITRSTSTRISRTGRGSAVSLPRAVVAMDMPGPGTVFVAQRWITTGLLHALVAMDMPGPGTVFVAQRWSFPQPVYVGDTIRAEATVKSVRQDRPMAEIEFVITNQDGDEVLVGEATVFQARPTEDRATS